MKPGVKAFVVYQKKLLLILRDNKTTIAYPNVWNLPGGGIDDGETHLQALMRELQEEIGITPANVLYLGRYLNVDGNIVYRYVVRLTEKEVKKLALGDEGQGYDFFALHDIAHLPAAKHLQEYVAEYMDPLTRLVEKEESVAQEDLGLTP